MSLITNLTGYWKLEDTSDSSGNSRTLTNENSVTFTTAKILNGANGGATNTNKDLIIDGDSPAGITYAQFATGWTINFWVNETTTSAGGHVAVGMQVRSSPNRRQARIELLSSVIKLRMYDGVSDLYTSGVTVNTGDWNMVTYGYDGTNFFIYVNGVSKLSQPRVLSASGDDSAGGFGILSDREGGASFANFSGLIDECGAWSRVLTQAEITLLYNNNRGLTFPFSRASDRTQFLNFMIPAQGYNNA